MLSLAFGTWVRIGIAAALAAGLAWTHTTAYRAGETAVLDRLKDDRITVLKDGRRIDEEVLNADDVGLCALLGGCELPDNSPD